MKRDLADLPAGVTPLQAAAWILDPFSLTGVVVRPRMAWTEEARAEAVKKARTKTAFNKAQDALNVHRTATAAGLSAELVAESVARAYDASPFERRDRGVHEAKTDQIWVRNRIKNDRARIDVAMEKGRLLVRYLADQQTPR